MGYLQSPSHAIPAIPNREKAINLKHLPFHFQCKYRMSSFQNISLLSVVQSTLALNAFWTINHGGSKYSFKDIWFLLMTCSLNPPFSLAIHIVILSLFLCETPPTTVTTAWKFLCCISHYIWFIYNTCNFWPLQWACNPFPLLKIFQLYLMSQSENNSKQTYRILIYSSFHELNITSITYSITS